MDIWVFDLERSTQFRLTFTDGDDFTCFWIPNSRDLVFGSEGDKGRQGIFIQPADGSRPARRLRSQAYPGQYFFPSGFTADHSEVLYFTRGEDTTYDLYRVSLAPDNHGESAGQVLLATEFMEYFPTLSPDGGGNYPSWGPDGSVLYYLKGNQMNRVLLSVEGEAPRLGRSEVMFTADFDDPYELGSYDVDPTDGSCPGHH